MNLQKVVPFHLRDSGSLQSLLKCACLGITSMIYSAREKNGQIEVIPLI
jgi:hypothetical protein